MQDDNQKNLLLAVVLSVLILVGWQYFIVSPKMKEEQDKRAREVAAKQTQTVPGQPGQASTVPAAPGAPQTIPSSAAPAPAMLTLPREQVIAATPRVKIATPSIEGSINLKGGRIDDVSLVKYRQTTEPKSPPVVLLSPRQTPEPYFADFGWIATPGSNVKVPDGQTDWKAEGGQLTEASPVTLSWDNGGGLVFRRKISVDADSMFQIEDTVQSTGATETVLHHYATIAREGTPKIEGFYILHEGLIGVASDKMHELTYANLLKNLKDGESSTQTFEKVKGSWFGITDKYWGTSLVPDREATVDAVVTAYAKTPASKESYQVSYRASGITVAPGATQTFSTRLFAGAKDVKKIEAYEKTFSINKFYLMVDWGIFHFITIPMFHLIDWLAIFFAKIGMTANFGMAILATTVLVKAAFFPLANKSYESMAKMKKLQPEMERIRERYRDDRMRQQQEVMELYKNAKVNPMAGCLPVVIQIPVFFALYKVLFITLDMRHAPFYGWIKDLAAPDPTSIFNLFGLLPFDPTMLPVVGSLLHLGAWPIIMGITMFIQMQLNPQQPDPVQQRIFNLMPIVFTFMLASFPVGLVIYWAWNNILSVAQQYTINKKNGAEVHLWKNLGLERLLGGGDAKAGK